MSQCCRDEGGSVGEVAAATEPDTDPDALHFVVERWADADAAAEVAADDLDGDGQSDEELEALVLHLLGDDRHLRPHRNPRVLPEGADREAPSEREGRHRFALNVLVVGGVNAQEKGELPAHVPIRHVADDTLHRDHAGPVMRARHEDDRLSLEHGRPVPPAVRPTSHDARRRAE